MEDAAHLIVQKKHGSQFMGKLFARHACVRETQVSHHQHQQLWLGPAKAKLSSRLSHDELSFYWVSDLAHPVKHLPDIRWLRISVIHPPLCPC